MQASKYLTVRNYIYDSFNERGMRTFEKNAHRLLSKHYRGLVVIQNAWFERYNGHGNYRYVLQMEVNGNLITHCTFSSDSHSWDVYTGSKKERRGIALALIEDWCSHL